MNPVAQKYGAFTLAGVNLVPKEIAERRKVRAVRFAATVAVLIAIGVVVVLYLGALGAKAAASNDLDNTLADQATAIAARDAKATVYNDMVKREQEVYALSQAGYGEINYAAFTSAIMRSANGKATFNEIHITGPSALGNGGPEQDVLFGGGLGFVQFEARTSSVADANALLVRIEATPGIANVVGTAEAFTDDQGKSFWTVKGTATVTLNALTERFFYTDELTPIDPLAVQASQGLEPGEAPSPAPTASAEPSASPSATATSEG